MVVLLLYVRRVFFSESRAQDEYREVMCEKKVRRKQLPGHRVLFFSQDV